ncbi:TPA: hypothetical protein RQJ86_002187 [Vibrio vulnificus]|nr:hypothetical protein [Vibrio vulnificus]HDY7642447.1 hypothetical protein [Vibrio vulnificus]
MNLQRAKLFLVVSDINIVDIYNHLRVSDYNGSEYGFLNLSLLTGNRIHGTYVEKEDYSEDRFDPFGNYIETINFVNFKHIKFHIEHINEKKFLLVIYDPPRALKNFFDNLFELLQRKVGFRYVEFNLKKIIDDLEKQHGLMILDVGRIRVSGVIVDNVSKASIEISSVSNAFKSLSQLVEGQRYTIDKIVASLLVDDDVTNFEMSKTGTIKVDENRFNFILKAVSSSLLNRDGWN